MPPTKLPAPQITISKVDARRFMLAHHSLWPPRQHQGKEGILRYIQKVGSIQFDPINIVGRNPDLVLQSRVEDYRAIFLDHLLYEDRTLIDGWDKMACIYATTEWPSFTYRRDFLRENPNSRKPPDTIINETLEQIRLRGAFPQSISKSMIKLIGIGGRQKLCGLQWNIFSAAGF